MRIYLAGPYQPKSKNKHKCVREAAQNTDRAIVTGLELMKKGHVVYIPHLAHFIHTHHKCDREWSWHAYDRSFLEHWAEALYYMAASKGANAELRRAKELGITIFYRISKVPKGRDMIIRAR